MDTIQQALHFSRESMTRNWGAPTETMLETEEGRMAVLKYTNPNGAQYFLRIVKDSKLELVCAFDENGMFYDRHNPTGYAKH